MRHIDVCTVHRVAREHRRWSQALYTQAMEVRHLPEIRLREDCCNQCYETARTTLRFQLAFPTHNIRL